MGNVAGSLAKWFKQARGSNAVLSGTLLQTRQSSYVLRDINKSGKSKQEIEKEGMWEERSDNVIW